MVAARWSVRNTQLILEEQTRGQTFVIFNHAISRACCKGRTEASSEDCEYCV